VISERDEVRIERPPLPEGIKGRFREKWSPLKRVAAAAGGSWPELVDQMALRDLAEAELDREDGLINQKPGVLLLHHIYEVWPEGVSFVASNDLTVRLIREHPQVWSADSPFAKDLTPKRMALMLVKSYGIHSHQPVKTGLRGYSREMFVLPWRRMGVIPAEGSDASDASDASDPKPDSGTTSCTNCGQPLNPIDAEIGFTTHPGGCVIHDRHSGRNMAAAKTPHPTRPSQDGPLPRMGPPTTPTSQRPVHRLRTATRQPVPPVRQDNPR
jgi:hypothetical protein